MRTRTHEDKNIWRPRQGLKETGTQGHKNTRHKGTYRNEYMKISTPEQRDKIIFGEMAIAWMFCLVLLDPV
jgi:hypothetical protein